MIISSHSLYLGTVQSVVQLVGQLLLLLPGCLHQAGVHEGERLHDLLHGEARPGGLLSLIRAEHLQKTIKKSLILIIEGFTNNKQPLLGNYHVFEKVSNF